MRAVNALALCALLAFATAGPVTLVDTLAKEVAELVGSIKADISTNVCNLDWYYCPRDPGCKTYTMSVHSVMVRAIDYSDPVRAEDLKAGDNITVELKGETSLTKMPSQGSYRIYGLDGKNVAAGTLDASLTLSPPNFVFEATFALTSDAINQQNEWLEFGVDIFQEGSGSDEGVCIEIADSEYLGMEKSKPDPPFETYCKDLGNGTFVPDDEVIEGNPIPSPSCTKGQCSLHWYYCPRDPGCITYTMSVESVVWDVYDKDGINVGDRVRFIVNGTTSLTSIPVAGSYRIYDLAGHNVQAGVLDDVMDLHDCTSEGCKFGLALYFQAVAGCFGQDGWFEVTLDVFQEHSGSDEGMCIEIVDTAYLNYEETHPQPPPGFVDYCVDEGYGHFVNKTIKITAKDVTCSLIGAEGEQQ